MASPWSQWPTCHRWLLSTWKAQQREPSKKSNARAKACGKLEAAGMLSISCRALDYLVANKQLLIRRIGTRVLIPLSELQRFSRSDHPERLVG
jgi:hypothetical protein